MDFRVSTEQEALLDDIDEFVESEIAPLEADHGAFFDHRREDRRTNWDDGTPSPEWEALLDEMRCRSDEAGFYRLPLPRELGGRGSDTLTTTLAKEHLAAKGPGLHSVVHTGIAWETIIGEWRNLMLLYEHGTPAQRERYVDGALERKVSIAFGMTEPGHGSDPAYMETRAVEDDGEWVIDGRKRFIGGMHDADLLLLFARTSGQPGSSKGITTFLVPTDTAGLNIEYFHWMMNMPSTQAEIALDDVCVPEEAVLGELDAGLQQAGQDFLVAGWLGQATMALGTAQFCVDETVRYANERETFGTSLSRRQAIQFPVTELHAETELVRNLVYKVAWLLDQRPVDSEILELLSIANYRATDLATAAADQAIQVHGGRGWSRHYPFEYLYRQFRRYRITEGATEIQKRRAAGYLFGFL